MLPHTTLLLRRLVILLSLALASFSALAATTVSFSYARADEAVTITNPHATPVTVVMRGLGSNRAPVTSTLPGRETRTIPAALESVSNDATGMLVFEATDTITVGNSMRLALAGAPVSVTLDAASPVVIGVLSGDLRVTVYPAVGSTTPLADRTYSNVGERVLRLTLSDLLPGSTLTTAVVKVEPFAGAAAVAVDARTARSRAVRGGYLAPPVISVSGAACELGSGVRAAVSPVLGQTYIWSLVNASAPSTQDPAVDLTLGTRGYAIIAVTTLVGTHASRSEFSLRIEGLPTIRELVVTPAVVGERVTVSGRTDASSVVLSGTDLPQVTLTVTGGAFSYSYRPVSAGQKSLRAVAQNACGDAERTTNFTVVVPCSPPNAAITGVASMLNGTTATFSSGAAESHNWLVVSGPGTITGGQGTTTVTVQATAPGTIRLRHTASNGSCSATDTVAIAVTAPAAVIHSFTADSYTVGFGQSTTLRFNISNASSWTLYASHHNNRTPWVGLGSGSFTSRYTRNALDGFGSDVITLEVRGANGELTSAQLTIADPGTGRP